MKYLRDRPWVFGVLAAMVLMGLVILRTVTQSRFELATADAYVQHGNEMRALQHYRRAMRWSLPLNPYPGRAATSLRVMAKELANEGRVDDALLAWRSIAGSSTATRFLFSISNPPGDEARNEIARLMAVGERPGVDSEAAVGETEAAHRALLEEDMSPDPFWGTLLLFGFAAWVGALVVTASRGFDPAGRLEWAKARAPLSGALAGFLAFVLGMLFV